MKKTIEKSHQLDHVIYDVRGPVAQEAARMSQAGEEIIHLNIGNPGAFDFKAPDGLIKDLIAKAVASEGYSESKGLLVAREAIAAYCLKKGFPDVTADDVFTGNGVSELIKLSMSALLDRGDEVLVPAPDYPLWTAEVTLAGGTAVHYICDEGADWMPDLADIKRKITSHTKAIVLINPNNPTGALYSRDLLEDIVALAREHDLIIFSDEIYDRLVMDGLTHTSVAALAPDLLVVTLNGLSKSHLIAGFRIGWLVLSGDKSHAAGYIEGLNMLASMRLCSNVLAQQVVPAALADTTDTDRMLLPGGRLYEQRETIYQAVTSIPGLSAVKPHAAFYIFPKLDIKKFNIRDDETFAFDFLHQERVLVVHGTGFNWIAPDHFRIVYLPKVADLQLTADRLSHFLATYQQK